MRFSILLYGFFILLRYTSWRHHSFKEKLFENDFSMCIKTENERNIRYYYSNNKKLESKKALDSKADFSLIWRDSKSGYNTLKKSSNRALMKALSSGELKIEGDASKVTWFLEITNMLKKIYFKKKK